MGVLHKNIPRLGSLVKALPSVLGCFHTFPVSKVAAHSNQSRLSYRKWNPRKREMSEKFLFGNYGQTQYYASILFIPNYWHRDTWLQGKLKFLLGQMPFHALIITIFESSFPSKGKEGELKEHKNFFPSYILFSFYTLTHINTHRILKFETQYALETYLIIFSNN